MAFPATVDISRQMAPLVAFPGLDQSAWYQDIFAKVMQLSGWFNIAVGNAPPSDTRKIWYKVANPPSGAPGQPYVFDAEADDWVSLTPDALITYLALTPRAKDFVQTYAPTEDQNPLPGDWWLDTSTGRLSRYITIAAATTIWLDISGATLDGTTLAALQAKPITTVAALPAANTCPGKSYMVTDAATGLIGSIVAAGGANHYAVTSDGTVWRIG